MSVAATALLLALAGYGYLALVGTATMLVILPRQYLPYRVLLAPLFGWATLVALGYPLSAVLPFRVVAPTIALASCSVIAVAALRSLPMVTHLVAGRRAWHEAAWPFALASLTYVAAVRLHARQNTLTALVVDSDAEHFADVIASLLHFPTGWSVEAYRGLEITPIGFGYHAIHAMLSAVTGIDVFTTALPSHFLLLGLAVPAVYFFARRSLALSCWAAAIAVALYCLGPIPLIVASFGWGQQTAALAAVPFGVACLLDGLDSHDRRMVFAAGLAVGLATGSLYLATTPLLVGTAAFATLLISLRASKERRHGGGNGLGGRISWCPRSGFFGAILAPWRRLMLIGAVALAAGSFSHLGAASYLLERIGTGLVTDEEMQHRSVHVPQFAPPLAAIGVAPLDLFGTIVAADRQTALEWQDTPITHLSTAGGAALFLIGTLRVARIRSFGLSLLAAALA
ncbi:MAG TPA: hypothetical protein VGW38_10980, partial [Chloroflexota bacterium]|nr:hypothetical protein [Chloroflexota bacterium]